MKLTPWSSEISEQLRQWAAEDEGVAEALGLPDNMDLEEWLDFAMQSRAGVLDDSGQLVAVVGLMPVYSPHIFVSPDHRGGRTALRAAEAGMNLLQEAGARIVMATPRRDNEASAKLCRKIGLIERPRHAVFIGRIW